MNLARLNHILIPKTKAERDRFRRGRTHRVFRFIIDFWGSLTREGVFLFIFWPLLGAVSLNIQYSHSYIFFSLLTGLLMAAVAMRGIFRLDQVRLEVSAPPRVTVGEEITLAVTVHNGGERLAQALRVRGPFLPWDGAYTQGSGAMRQLLPGASTETRFKATFAERGEHHLDPFSVRALVPLGLTTSAPVLSGGLRFMVVPRIASVLRLDTPLGLRYQPGGVALASRTGESMELIGVRPYRPGDPIRDLHARTWARIGQPVVREYQQEYFSRIGVVLDTESAGLDDPRLEASISLAAGVVANLSRGEALIDLLVVGDQVHQLTLGRNLGFLDQALDLLACVNPAPELDLRVLEERLDPHLSRLSCVVMVALTWDDSRRHLVERIAARQVGCRTLLVPHPGAETLPVAEDGVTVVSVDAINRGEGLLL